MSIRHRIAASNLHNGVKTEHRSHIKRSDRATFRSEWTKQRERAL